jgi:hypothetical protein
VVIWVDLEAVYTLAGLVDAILDGCRRVDAELPPAVMPLGALSQSRDEALERLEHALQRLRYAVMVDGMQTYASSPLMHHSFKKKNETKVGHAGTITSTEGTVSKGGGEKDEKEVELAGFLEMLTKRPLGQSIIVASRCGEGVRHSIKADRTDLNILKSPTGQAELPLLWTCLATIRRTRSLPSVRELLAPLLPPGKDGERTVDTFLCQAANKETPPLRLMEGGDLWFVRSVRDEIYAYATRFTSDTCFKELEGSENEVCRWPAFQQSLLMALLHRKIASTYFTLEFMQSGDASSFLEYTYHRISSVRYFSRVIYLWTKYGTAWCEPGVTNTAVGGGPTPVAQSVVDKQKMVVNSQLKDWFNGLLGRNYGYFGTILDNLIKQKTNYRFCTFLCVQRESELEALLSSWKEFEQIV